jgi:hypothetical protein
MANAIRDHIWFVDTAGAANVVDETVIIEAVRWVGATTAAHEAVIENAEGEVIWRSVASADSPTSDKESTPGCFRALGGFSVPTLGSGQLFIYGKLYY